MNEPVLCPLCPRHCRLSEGQIGFCGARQAKGGEVIPLNYGQITSFALDPIEKKPLAYYCPGSMILSAGSFGCNMACPFCQNHHISRSKKEALSVREVSPGDLIALAKAEKRRGNIGLAFTYNEPLIAFEFVLQTAKLAQSENLKTVLVTNGQICEPYLKELLPYISAWNIDLKAFSEDGYRRLGGDFKTALRTIESAFAVSHVEVTTLVVPGISDSAEEMRAEAEYLANLSPYIPLHLSRYFPSYRYTEPATSKSKMRELKEIAGQYLERVRFGNMT
ncbi:MAG: AmmeMemoRadiSam system radical SAM enzyme [Ruminococcaceae bacterium]|nr:AmmeMemoRadiSam system radical SAM enzyme [Oscillospiraceae bacterium]